jgi:TPR repeat protein
VAKDVVAAYKWLNLSAEQGIAEAKVSLQLLEVRLTREQAAEGLRLSHEFKLRQMTPLNGASSAP